MIRSGRISASPRYGISSLLNKRHQIEGQMIGLRCDLAEMEALIKRIDDALVILDPAYDAASLPRRKSRKRVRLFNNGELGRLIVVFLRQAKSPLGCHDIAARVAERRGVPPSVLITRRVRSNLTYLESQGRIIRVGRGKGTKWAILYPKVIAPLCSKHTRTLASLVPEDRRDCHPF